MVNVETEMTDGNTGCISYFGKFDFGLRTETERGLQVIFGKVTGNRVTGLRTAENRWIPGHRIWIVCILTAEATLEIRYNLWGSKWYKVEDIKQRFI